MLSAHYTSLPSCDYDNTLKRSDTVNNENHIDNDGLFILGILESAANEKKVEILLMFNEFIMPYK